MIIYRKNTSNYSLHVSNYNKKHRIETLGRGQTVVKRVSWFLKTLNTTRMTSYKPGVQWTTGVLAKELS